MTRLPTELERLVFEYAAVNSSRIPTLLLVAHRVRVWLEPMLYDVLLFDGVKNIESVLKVMLSKPPSFLESAVHHFLLFKPTFLETRHTLQIYAPLPRNHLPLIHWRHHRPHLPRPRTNALAEAP
ncbi:hypothetical protein R3P38DRAFT_2960760 [Favolaschia claudopus]|uniref:F-box domain-containing protein n=1 Tax=Favolaschia claudopus TaxID=2862362 RepID=A0AAW0B992_9AGAR